MWSLAGKGLTSWFSCMLCYLVFFHFPIQCPGSGLVFDCIDSGSLHSSSLCMYAKGLLKIMGAVAVKDYTKQAHHKFCGRKNI